MHALASWLAENRAALAISLGMTITLRVALEIVGLLASTFIPTNNIGLVRHPSPNALLDIWARWDGVRYLTIAAQGYHPNNDNLAFFPLYPASIRLLSGVFSNDMVLTGLVIGTLSFAAALFYLYKLVRLDWGKELAERTVFYLSISPMSFFFFAVYTEPLFLLLSIASIYHARRSQWIASVVFGALAVLTRPPGILLLVPLGYEAFRQWREKKPGVYLALPGMSLLPAALAGWMFYLYQLTGDPLAFVHAQGADTWHRSTDAPWDTLLAAFRRLILTPPDSYNHAQYGVDLAAALILLAGTVLAFQYLPRLYGLYMGASVALFLTSRSDLQVLFSLPRFAIVIFPLFILLAMAGGHRQLDRFITISMLAMLGLYTALFVQWYWIA